MVETHQLGKSDFIAVKSGDGEARDWLGSSPECRQLQQKNIAHVGVMSAVHPFRVVRLFQSGTFMFACISGCGEVLVDGTWRKVEEKKACLLPPFTTNAMRAVKGEPVWKFCWVRYLESPDRNPMVSLQWPAKKEFDADSLLHAVEGLHAECRSLSPSSAQCHLWIELIHGYVMGFAEPAHGDPRLWRLWQKVEADVGWQWSIKEMAAIAAVSEEHLRRLCFKELGRSPGKHVTSLRMQRACHLLSTTDEKVAVIAQQVGYTSPFTFSATFKKWTGLQPSAYRNHG